MNRPWVLGGAILLVCLVDGRFILNFRLVFRKKNRLICGIQTDGMIQIFFIPLTTVCAMSQWLDLELIFIFYPCVCATSKENKVAPSISKDDSEQATSKRRGCLGLLHKLHRGASLQKNWSLWSTSLGALTTLPFFLEQSAWNWNYLTKKRKAELKNVERYSPKHSKKILSLFKDHSILLPPLNQTIGKTWSAPPISRF
jgi:hypothetical protein